MLSFSTRNSVITTPSWVIQAFEAAQLHPVVVRVAEVDRVRLPALERDRALDRDAERFEPRLLGRDGGARDRDREVRRPAAVLSTELKRPAGEAEARQRSGRAAPQPRPGRRIVLLD